MTDRELMQQALDAMLNFPNDISDEMFEAMKALKAQLAQPDLITPVDVEQLARIEKLIDKIDPYEAQPEPEPVWVEVTTNTGDKFILDSAVEADKIRAAKDAGLSVVPLYTAPPQREWVGLTKEEARELCVANVPYVVDMVTALEAKLKEKNHG